eukprot:835808_1
MSKEYALEKLGNYIKSFEAQRTQSITIADVNVQVPPTHISDDIVNLFRQKVIRNPFTQNSGGTKRGNSAEGDPRNESDLFESFLGQYRSGLENVAMGDRIDISTQDISHCRFPKNWICARYPSNSLALIYELLIFDGLAFN